MRGRVDSQGDVFHTFNVHDLIPPQHPLREIKRRADQVLAGISRDFNAAYGKTGRPSIPPERLIKALLLQALYSIRSDIQLCEQTSYNLLFRWFLDLQPSEAVWTPEVFSMNRQRFADHGFVRTFFDRIVRAALLEGVASREHFAVDGTLIQSYASLKSVRSIDQPDEKVSDGSDDDDPGNPTVDFRGQLARQREGDEPPGAAAQAPQDPEDVVVQIRLQASATGPGAVPVGSYYGPAFPLWR